MCVRSPFTDTHVIRPTTQIHLNEHRADLIHREILLLSRAGLDTYLRVQPLGARILLPSIYHLIRWNTKRNARSRVRVYRPFPRLDVSSTLSYTLYYRMDVHYAHIHRYQFHYL